MGDRPIASIQPSDIHAFAANLIQPADAKVKPLATSSTRLLLARLSSVMAFTVDSGLVETNPVTASRIHKRLGSGKAKRRLDTAGMNWSRYSATPTSSSFDTLRAGREARSSGYR